MDMLTVKQAAALLGIAPRTVQDRIARHELPCERVTARLYLIPRAALAGMELGKRPPGRKPASPLPRGPKRRE